MFKVILRGFSVILIGAFITSSYISWCVYALYKNSQGDIK
jgi:hypothetical protein